MYFLFVLKQSLIVEVKGVGRRLPGIKEKVYVTCASILAFVFSTKKLFY
jgi:hypothetical protein